MKSEIALIENHYLGSVIKKNQFDTFYHEHPRTYSLKSFVNISKLLECNLIHFSFPKRYGGNIRVIFSKHITPGGHFLDIILYNIKYEYYIFYIIN